jgi:ribonuclease HI
MLDWNLAVGFFDGASQCDGSKCGAGAILKCPDLGFYNLKMNCGSRTNTRGELLALWCILYIAHFKQIKSLQLVRDLKIIID